MRGVAQNLIGTRSGKLVVTHGPFKREGMSGLFWQCKCDCGNLVDHYIGTNQILKSKARSCGCFMVEQVKKSNTTHGLTKTRTYVSWRSMWQRCTDQNHKSYEAYKDKTPVDRWKSFELFLQDMGERPPKTSLERIDNLKAYSPENCKWATAFEQQQNKNTNIFVEIDGNKVCLKQACRLKNASYVRAKNRVRIGWNPIDAIMLPAFSRRPTLLPNNLLPKDAT